MDATYTPWHPPKVAAVLPPDANVEIVSPSPGQIHSGDDKTRRKLRSIEKRFGPDLTLTVFGPAYWIPESHHICGFCRFLGFLQPTRTPGKTRSFKRPGHGEAQMAIISECISIPTGPMPSFWKPKPMARAVRKTLPEHQNICGAQ